MPGGWTCFLSIHDDAYMRTLKAWKRKRAASHPDKGGTSAKFRAAYQAMRKWQQEECQWYAQLGLLPPDGCRLAEHKARQVQRRLALSS